jgi:hypothetical protein
MDKVIEERNKMKSEVAANNARLALKMQNAERAEIQHLLEQMEEKIGLIIKNRNHDKDASPLDIMLDVDGKISVVPPCSDGIEREQTLASVGSEFAMPENLNKAWVLLMDKYKNTPSMTFNPVDHVVHIA